MRSQAAHAHVSRKSQRLIRCVTRCSVMGGTVENFNTLWGIVWGTKYGRKKKIIFIFFFFSKIAPRSGQIGQSYLALGRDKLRKSSKVEFIGANSDFRGVEMIPVPLVLAQIVQNEPWWAKLALEKLGPISLLGSIWLFSFYIELLYILLPLASDC